METTLESLKSLGIKLPMACGTGMEWLIKRKINIISEKKLEKVIFYPYPVTMYTDRPWRYCRFGSRPLQLSQYRSKKSHRFFGFPVQIKVMLTQYCSLFSVQ